MRPAVVDLLLRCGHLRGGRGLLLLEFPFAVGKLTRAVIELRPGIVDLGLAFGDLLVGGRFGVIDGGVGVVAHALGARGLALFARVLHALLDGIDHLLVLVRIAKRCVGARYGKVNNGVDVGLHVGIGDKEGVLRPAARAERHRALAGVHVLRVEHDGRDFVFLAGKDGRVGRVGVEVHVHVGRVVIAAFPGSIGIVAVVCRVHLAVKAYGVADAQAGLLRIAAGHGNLVATLGQRSL